MKIEGNRNGAIFFLSVIVFFALFAGNIFAQDFDFLAKKIRTGSTEEKRDVLFQLRNLETAEASRIAVPALQDADEIVRVTAAYAVIFLSADETAQALLPLLQDKSPFVRKETAYALGKTKSLIVVQSLIKVLETDKLPEVKTASVIALGEIGKAAAVDSLVRILQNKSKDSEVFLRRSAARAIGQIAQVQQTASNYVVTPESLLPEKYDTFANLKYSNLAETNPVFQKSVSVLLSVLKNEKESDDVRREAAFALGTIGDKSVIALLQNNLTAKDYYLAEICKEGLLKIQNSKN